MNAETPVILIASASAYEQDRLGLDLEKTGWNLRGVEDAEEAARACAAHNGASVLVIDSGLLEMAHDPQWRVLRTRQPQLGAVVRCWIPRDGIKRANDRTFLVHPDDHDGICEAIAALGASRPVREPASRGGHPRLAPRCVADRGSQATNWHVSCRRGQPVGALRILVAEDDPAMAELVGDQLTAGDTRGCQPPAWRAR